MKTIKLDDNATLFLETLEDMVDISKVKTYTIEEVYDDGQTALVLKFYDKDGNVITLNGGNP